MANTTPQFDLDGVTRVTRGQVTWKFPSQFEIPFQERRELGKNRRKRERQRDRSKTTVRYGVRIHHPSAERPGPGPEVDGKKAQDAEEERSEAGKDPVVHPTEESLGEPRVERCQARVHGQP